MEETAETRSPSRFQAIGQTQTRCRKNGPVCLGNRCSIHLSYGAEVPIVPNAPRSIGRAVELEAISIGIVKPDERLVSIRISFHAAVRDVCAVERFLKCSQ